MNIYCPTFWPNGPRVDHRAATLALQTLLPALGGTTSACFDHYDRPAAGETVQLLWTPPVSDINGWSEQPSEIALSYLLTAKVVSDATLEQSSDGDPNFILRGKYRYALKILARERLLSVIKKMPAEGKPWGLPLTATAQGFTQFWAEVHWCGKAAVEGLIYLAASTRNEARLELLLDKEGEDLVGLFSMHLNPSGASFNLGRQRLTAVEQSAVRRAMAGAQLLVDSQAPYLSSHA